MQITVTIASNVFDNLNKLLLELTSCFGPWAFNARKNPGVADGDTKSAPVGFPAQRTNVESAGPGQTSSSGVTLTAVTVSYLGSGQVGWARGSYSRRKVW